MTDLDDDRLRAELKIYLSALANEEEECGGLVESHHKPGFLWVTIAAEWLAFLQRSFVLLLVTAAILAFLPISGGTTFTSLVILGFVALASVLAIE